MGFHLLNLFLGGGQELNIAPRYFLPIWDKNAFKVLEISSSPKTTCSYLRGNTVGYEWGAVCY